MAARGRGPGLRDAPGLRLPRGRPDPGQEHGQHPREERRDRRHRRAHLRPDRLQPDVRRRRLERPARLRRIRRRDGAGGPDAGVRRLHLLVRLHLPGDVRGDGGDDRLRRRRGARPDRSLPRVLRPVRGARLPHRRLLEVGRGLAGGAGLPRLRRVHARARRRRVGGPRRGDRPRAAPGQVRQRGRPPDHGPQPAARDGGDVPAVVRLVRLQRRLGAQRGPGRGCRSCS